MYTRCSQGNLQDHHEYQQCGGSVVTWHTWLSTYQFQTERETWVGVVVCAHTRLKRTIWVDNWRYLTLQVRRGLRQGAGARSTGNGHCVKACPFLWTPQASKSSVEWENVLQAGVDPSLGSPLPSLLALPPKLTLRN